MCFKCLYCVFIYICCNKSFISNSTKLRFTDEFEEHMNGAVLFKNNINTFKAILKTK